MFQPADNAERAFPPIIVSSELMLPHPAALALEQSIRGPADETGMVDNVGAGAFLVRVHRSSVARVLCIVDALAKAFDVRGFELRQGNQGVQPGSGMQVVVDGIAIDIVLTERVRLRPYRLDPAEIEQQKNGVFAATSPAELTQIGELSLKIGPVCGTRLRGIWTNTNRRRLEERLGEVLEMRRLAIWRRAERA